jgi:genome maintenance exonuclease 1
MLGCNFFETKPIRRTVTNSKEISEKNEDPLRNALLQEEKNDRIKLIERYRKVTEKSVVNKEFLKKQLFNIPIESYNTKSNSSLFTKTDASSMNSFLKKNSFITPSVTSIIKLSQPLEGALLEWKLEKVRELGMAGFLAEMNSIKDYSSKFHKFVEDTLEKRIEKTIFDEKLKHMDHLFADIGKVLLTEADVMHSQLFYKGRVDCLAYFKNDLCLIDWKLSDKRKKDVKSMYEYPIQLAAYWGALQNDTRFKSLFEEHTIKYAVVVNVHKPTGELDIHRFDIKSIHGHWNDWLLYLSKFWSLILKEKQIK